MKLGAIALKLRLGGTRFEERVFGAAEFALVPRATVTNESAFVLPLIEMATPNEQVNTVQQRIVERFGVVVALNNNLDTTGLRAFDDLEDCRAEIFKAILGWNMPGAESVVSYASGRLLDITHSYLWYQFAFQVESRIDIADCVEPSIGAPFDMIYAQWKLNPTADELKTIMDTLPLVSAAVDSELQVDLV